MDYFLSRNSESSPRLWQCYATNSLKTSKASHCVFSPDASVLAVAYKDCISIWETATIEHKHSLTSEQLKDYIRSLVFGYSCRDKCVLASTRDSVIVWDVVSYDVIWVVSVDNALLCATPYTMFVVAVSNEKILLFDPEEEKPVIQLDTGVDVRIIDACFLGQGNTLAVYFLTDRQELYCLHDANEFDFMTNNNTPPLKLDSIFSDLLTGPEYTPLLVEDTRLFKKADLSIFNTPCHILPDTKSYAWNVISEFLEKREDIKTETEDIQVDSMVTEKGDRYVEHKMNGISEEEGNVMDFNWLDSFFRSSEYVPT